ncbi:hypothetical protein [Capnocytophaga catalasegens]|nr:hypothetical protein [Capnocytophaga catalasegens]
MKNVIKKSIISYVIAWLITYFSMIDYSDSLSSACLNCSYTEDVALYSLLLLPLFFITFLFLERKAKNNNLSSIFLSVMFTFLVLLNNVSIFSDRASSWSTFSIMEEFLATLIESYLFLIIGIAIFLFIFREKRLFMNKNNTIYNDNR